MNPYPTKTHHVPLPYAQRACDKRAYGKRPYDKRPYDNRLKARPESKLRLAFVALALLVSYNPLGWASPVISDAAVYLASKSSTTNAAQVQRVGTVDLNTASVEQLAANLKGVGVSKARAIVRYRTEVGPFRSIEELEEVKGIGPSTVARNKERMTLSKPKR